MHQKHKSIHISVADLSDKDQGTSPSFPFSPLSISRSTYKYCISYYDDNEFISFINCTSLSNAKGLEPLRLEEELDIHHLETLMFKFMTHIPDKVALKKWLMRRGSMFRDQTRFHFAGLMTQEEFHEMLADLLGVETWDSQKVALFDKEIGTLFKKVLVYSLSFTFFS